MTQNTTSSSSHHPHPHPHPHHHRRTQSSNASKVRPARPTLHRRGTTAYSIHKLGSGQPRPVKDVGDDFDMTSFLNFCAMCERQITVPDNSLLYCSESCRRKDSCKPLAASCPSSTTPTMPSSSTTTPPSSPPMSPRMIVPPLTPTRLPSSKSGIPIRIPNDHHHHHNHNHNHEANQTDLDPTEWNPVIGSSAPGRFTTLASSDAWLYLSQFHDEPMLPMRRPGSASASASVKRGSTTSLSAFSAPGTSTHALPALANTPSTMASSFSSTASDASMHLQDPTMALHHRPLPPRHKNSSKSVELVVPHVNAPVVDVTAPEERGEAEVSDRGSIFPASSSLWG